RPRALARAVPRRRTDGRRPLPARAPRRRVRLLDRGLDQPHPRCEPQGGRDDDRHSRVPGLLPGLPPAPDRPDHPVRTHPDPVELPAPRPRASRVDLRADPAPLGVRHRPLTRPDPRRNPTMARFIDIHVLQYLPISCVNRDDAGMPKTVTISGVRRARWSSQSQKSIVRGRMRELLPAADLSTRTRLLPQLVLEELIGRGVEASEARKLVTAQVQNPLLKGAGAEDEGAAEDDSSDLATKVLLSIPHGSVARIADAIAAGEKLNK